MLSVTHPGVMEYVRDLPVGLLPIIFEGDSLPRLIVKANKELILAAKVRKSFFIHLVPYEVAGVRSVGFLAAFPDDHQHPLILAGALVKEILASEMCTVFTAEEVNVHFFDELGREVLAYRANFFSSDEHKELLEKTEIPSVKGLNQSAILTRISEWFRISGSDEDDRAIKVKLIEPLFPENFVYIDMRNESHRYHGSSDVSQYTLEREEPGAFQEKEIALLLERTFGANSIYFSPKRIYDREEVADILVVTERSVVIVQAKDSPNLEKTINLPISRKKSTAVKALRKAAAQVMGAAKYLLRKQPVVFFMDDTKTEISLNGKSVYGLLIMKELFDDDFDEYTPPLLKVHEQVGVPVITLSYSELHQYTSFLEGDEAFFDAFMKVFNWGCETGMFPRLRVMPPGSIINDPVD